MRTFLIRKLQAATEMGHNVAATMVNLIRIVSTLVPHVGAYARSVDNSIFTRKKLEITGHQHVLSSQIVEFNSAAIANPEEFAPVDSTSLASLARCAQYISTCQAAGHLESIHVLNTGSISTSQDSIARQLSVFHAQDWLQIGYLLHHIPQHKNTRLTPIHFLRQGEGAKWKDRQTRLWT